MGCLSAKVVEGVIGSVTVNSGLDDFEGIGTLVECVTNDKTIPIHRYKIDRELARPDLLRVALQRLSALVLIVHKDVGVAGVF